MLDLWRVEWFKLKNSTYFWVLSGLFLLFMFSLPLSVQYFLEQLAIEGADFRGLDPTDLPVFDFVDIWQNLTYSYKYFSIFLGFIIIISITSEYSHGTFRQHVMDGWSPAKTISAKFSIIVVLSLFVTLMVLFVVGFLYSPVNDLDSILSHIGFIPAYFLHLVAFQALCMLIAMLVKRSGISIALIIFWVYMIEPIISALLTFWLEVPWLAGLLPFEAVGKMIANPFPKFILRETQNYVSFADLGTHLVYMGGIIWACYALMTKRDVR